MMTGGLDRAKISPDMRFDVIVLRSFSLLLISAGYVLHRFGAPPGFSGGRRNYRGCDSAVEMRIRAHL